MIPLNPSDLLPHEPPMVLLDSIVELGEEHAVTCVKLTRDMPQAGPEGVPSAWALEIMAQAAALMIAKDGEKSRFRQGRLVKAAEFIASQSVLPLDVDLRIEVSNTAASDSGVFMFDGRVIKKDSVLASGRFTIFAR